MRRLTGTARPTEMIAGARLEDVPVTPSPGVARSGLSRRRLLAEIGAAGAVYLVLACLIYWPASPLDATRLAGCACGDPEQQTWFLAWTSYALTHGLNPFLTSYLHAPAGANLAIDTSMPLLGALGMPVTLLAGPIATFNLLLRIGLAASGASMFGVLRRYVPWWPAAFGGGLLFAFSPYLANQAVRHLFLIFVPLVPLLIPLLDDWLVSRTRSPLRSGLLIGLVAGLQYLISPEILLTSALMAVVGLGFLALRYRDDLAERARLLAKGAVTAVPVFGVIAGYAVWMLLAGPLRPRGAVHTLSGLTRYHGDLLSPLFPTSHQLIAPSALASVGNALPTGATIEDGFYLGLPLLLLLGYLIVRCRKVPLVGAAAVVGVVAFILGLGPKLTLNGKSTGVPLPFEVFLHLPVLQNLEAARLSLFIQVAAAIIFAVGLDRVYASGWLPAASADAGRAQLAGRPAPAGATTSEGASAARSGPVPGAVPAPGSAPAVGLPRSRRPGQQRTALVLVAGLIALLPLMPNLPIKTVVFRTPGLFTGNSASAIPQGTLALTLPYDIAPQNEAMMWQQASGMRFRMLGGDAFVPGPHGRSTWHPVPEGPPVLTDILRAGRYKSSAPPPTSPAAVSALRQLCLASRIGVILVDRQGPAGSAFALLVTRALGTQPAAKGHLDVWLNVQGDLQRHAG
jgi:hypothetical protein